MSSATNHKKRSRRGYKMQRTFLAPQQSPLIRHDKKGTAQDFPRVHEKAVPAHER